MLKERKKTTVRAAAFNKYVTIIIIRMTRKRISKIYIAYNMQNERFSIQKTYRKTLTDIVRSRARREAR